MDNDNFNKNIEKNNILEDSPINTDIVPQSEIKINEININNLILTVKKDTKPDVYHIYDNNNLIHFASIPDTITSQLCYDGLKNVDSALFKCIMCPKWKRYKPIELVKN